MSSRFRFYIHAPSPLFIPQLRSEVSSLLTAASPHSRAPRIHAAGTSALEVTASLRDLYVLSHGLRTADDIMVQLAPRNARAGSYTQLVRQLRKIPLHAYAHRFAPWSGTGRRAALRGEESREQQLAEAHLLHNNVRVLSHSSILSDKPMLQEVARAAVRDMLQLPPRARPKAKAVEYTENPRLWGRTLGSVAAGKEARQRFMLEAAAEADREAEKAALIEAGALEFEDDDDVAASRSDSEASDALAAAADAAVAAASASSAGALLPLPDRSLSVAAAAAAAAAARTFDPGFTPGRGKRPSGPLVTVDRTGALPPSALLLPPPPVDDVAPAALTIRLEKNHLAVSLSAAGSKDYALHKRGWRERVVETSLRETVAAGLVALVQKHSSPLPADTPLLRLGTDPEFTAPLQGALRALAKDIPSLAAAAIAAEQGGDATGAYLEQNKDELTAKGVLAYGENPSPAVAPVAPSTGAPSTGAPSTGAPSIGAPATTSVPSSDAYLSLTSYAAPPTPTLVPAPSPGGSLRPAPARPEVLAAVSDMLAHPAVAEAAAAAAAAAATGDRVPLTLKGKGGETEFTRLIAAAAADAAGVATDLSAAENSSKDGTLALASSLAPSPRRQDKSVQVPPVHTHARDGASLQEVLGYTLSQGVLSSAPTMRLFDPFCGAGTLVIESVYRWMGLPTPPLPRPFAFEDWPIHNELEYNTLMHDWSKRYEDVLQGYLQTFGGSKRLWKEAGFPGADPAVAAALGLNGDGSSGPLGKSELTLDNFPLFVGSDLRDKAVMSAVNNARAAGVGLFTQFYRSDFEDIISEAGDSWVDHLVAAHKRKEDAAARARRRRRGAGGGLGVDMNSLRAEKAAAAAAAEEEDGQPRFGAPRDETGGEYFHPGAGSSGSSNIISLDSMSSIRPSPPATSPRTGRPLLDLPFPHLKGYTLVANVPWGVSDEDTRSRGGRRAINTTQQESLESVYMRLGRSLSRHGHLFRDVFIVSAHAKFETLTRVGAERAARDDAAAAALAASAAGGAGAGGAGSSGGAKKRELALRTQLAEGGAAGAGTGAEITWDRVASFYNNGVKTHVLKLNRKKF